MVALIVAGLLSITFISALKIAPLIHLGGYGIQETKDVISIFFCSIIGLYSFYKGKNKSISLLFPLLILYIIISQYFLPPIVMVINGIDEGGFWIYKPILISVVCFLAFVAISSHCFTWNKINTILKFIYFSAIAMSILVCIQALGLDQFYVLLPNRFVHAATKASLVGTIGNSTWVSAFIIISTPISLYLKRYFGFLFLVGIVFLLQSQMAIFAMLFGLIIYGIRIVNISYWKQFAFIIAIIILFGSIVMLQPKPISKYIGTNGRIEVWKQTFDVISSPFAIINIDDEATPEQREYADSFNNRRYTLFGYGMGSYQYIISERIGTNFKRLHNEFFEVLCNLGVIGFCLFFGAICTVFYSLFKDRTEMSWLFISILSIICLNALGTTVWQVEPSRYCSLILFAMAYGYANRVKYASI